MRGMDTIRASLRGLSLTLALSSVALSAAETWAWTRTSAPNGAFSAETPCSDKEIELLKKVPEDILPGGAAITVQSRVFCKHGSLLLLASDLVATDLPARGPSLFDMVVAQGVKNPGANGRPVISIVDGRRALKNRQLVDGTTAQTGFIELSRNEAVLIVSGVGAENGLDAEAQGNVVDRFWSSIQVITK